MQENSIINSMFSLILVFENLVYHLAKTISGISNFLKFATDDKPCSEHPLLVSPVDIKSKR